MKRLILLVLAFILFLLVGGGWFITNITAVSGDKTLKRFVVLPGEAASQIGQELEKAHLIKSGLGFRIYSQITQSARNIKPGSYELSSNLWVPQIVARLLQGPTEVWVTIPEGFRREEIGAKFVQSFGLTGKEATDFYQQFLEITKDKEGYLFPDTYLLAKDTPPSDVVKVLRSTFDEKVGSNISYNSLILASILERETKTAEERPVVAGILTKRLNAGWPLQTDATIQYFTATRRCGEQNMECEWWKAVTGEDLSLDSAYNTYKNTGLPPSPIANPGESSIKAALNPTTSSYWYYIHDKEGQIHYAATIEEQGANIAKYLE